jgi:hypothetical protein
LTPGGEFVSLELKSSRQDGHGKVQELKLINEACRWYLPSFVCLSFYYSREQIHLEYIPRFFSKLENFISEEKVVKINAMF